jgi:hypothetical protein
MGSWIQKRLGTGFGRTICPDHGATWHAGNACVPHVDPRFEEQRNGPDARRLDVTPNMLRESGTHGLPT